MAPGSVVVLSLAATVAAATPSSSARPAAARSCRGLTDNILCMPLPRGWHRSVGFGHAGGGPAAWLLAGNFPFTRNAAKAKGGPDVPPGRVLITIGDMPILGNWGRGWRRVRRLRLPLARPHRRRVSWHVRFAGRALFLSVRFGSRPGTRLRRLAARRLNAVRRVG